MHVWLVELDQPEPEVQRLRRLLSADERARADRFHFERDRRRFTVTRGALRTVLAEYLEVNTADVRFAYQTFGKPVLADRRGPCFNVSHSGALALIGVTGAREIGVDLEEKRPLDDLLQIARHYFSEAERRALEALPVGLRQDGFFNCWTRKEAFIKASGEGLSVPLHAFDVSLAPGEPARLLATRTGRPLGGWRLYGLEPGPGYVGAIAVEGEASPLERWRWAR